MSTKLDHRLNDSFSVDISVNDGYCDTWDRIRIVQDVERPFEDGQWQVDGIAVQNGRMVGYTEYVSNWMTFEGAISYGVEDLLMRIGNLRRLTTESS